MSVQISHAVRYAFGVVGHLTGCHEMPMTIKQTVGPDFTVPGWEDGMAGGGTGRTVRVRLGFAGGLRADVFGEENDDSRYGTQREFTRCVVTERCEPVHVEGEGPNGWPLPPHTRRRRVWTKGALPAGGWGWSLVVDETYAPGESAPAAGYSIDQAFESSVGPAWLAVVEAATEIPGMGSLSPRQVSDCLRAGARAMARQFAPLPGVRREVRRWQHWLTSGGLAEVRRRQALTVPDMDAAWDRSVYVGTGAAGLAQVASMLLEARRYPDAYLGRMRARLESLPDEVCAAGVGLTLTAASRVVFVELDWTPKAMNQAEDRCHRIGQKDTVLVQHLVIDGTLDAKIAKMLVRKQDVADSALDRTMAIEAPAPAPAPAILDDIAFTSCTCLAAPDGSNGHASWCDMFMQIPAMTLIDATPAAPIVSRETSSKSALTEAEITKIHAALRTLAEACDGANSKDGSGFNKMDAAFGHGLAMRETLTEKQALAARRMLRKYKRQIGEV
jgi:hypothetical protein